MIPDIVSIQRISKQDFFYATNEQTNLSGVSLQNQEYLFFLNFKLLNLQTI